MCVIGLDTLHIRVSIGSGVKYNIRRDNREYEKTENNGTIILCSRWDYNCSKTKHAPWIPNE